MAAPARYTGTCRAAERTVRGRDLLGQQWPILHGGYGLHQSDSKIVNDDLWVYDSATNNWTYIWGNARSRSGGLPNYGALGGPHPANTPGGRANATIWIGDDGNLFLFGGRYEDFDHDNSYTDLWTYDFDSGMWTWLGGASIPNAPRHIGAAGVPHPATRPAGDLQPDSERGAYSDASGPVWVRPDGTLWKFDGRDVWRLDWLKTDGGFQVDAGFGASICRGISVLIGPEPRPGVRYRWSDGLGDSSIVRTSPNRTTTFYLSAYDSTDGSWSLDSLTIIVRDRTDATFIYTLDRDLFSPRPYDTDVSVVQWNFGDGSVMSDRTPQHRYDSNGTYVVRLIARTNYGVDTAYSTIRVDGITSVDAVSLLATDDSLVPNPVVGMARLSFSVMERAPVTVTILDVTGRVTATILDGVLASGEHCVPIDPEALGLTTGAWLVRLKVGNSQYVVPLIVSGR